MNRVYVLIVCLIVSTTFFAQIKVAELPINYKSEFFKNKESLVISNEETNELLVLVEDKKKTSVCLLDSAFKTISNLEIESLPKSFKVFLGYSLKGDDYSIFFSNNIKTKYGVLKVNFKTKSVVNEKIDFKLTGEEYVQSLSFNNQYYLVSISSKPSMLHFYTFTNGLTPTSKNSIDFSYIDKRSSGGYNAHAKNLIVGNEFGSKQSNSLVKIDRSTPNSIEVASNKNKLYIIDNKFVFTFDHEKEVTKTIVVDPNDFSKEEKSFDQPVIKGEFFSQNSYIHDNKLFQIKCNSSMMKFTIKDFSSKKLLKQITLNKKDSIKFKNTPVLQERVGGIYAGNREFEKTSKFLRKISQGDIGVVVYKDGKDVYKITLGSKKEMNNGGAAMMPGFGAIPLSGVGSMSMAFNPTMFAYSAYSSTKSVRIECLFDNDFNHIEGKPKDNVFDDIRAFEDTFDKKLTYVRIPSNYFYNNTWNTHLYSFKQESDVKLKNVFLHNDKMYFAFLGSKDKNYHIMEF